MAHHSRGVVALSKGVTGSVTEPINEWFFSSCTKMTGMVSKLNKRVPHVLMPTVRTNTAMMFMASPAEAYNCIDGIIRVNSDVP